MLEQKPSLSLHVQDQARSVSREQMYIYLFQYERTRDISRAWEGLRFDTANIVHYVLLDTHSGSE